MKILYRYGLDLSGSDSMANDAKSTGETAIKSFDPTTTAGSQKTALGSSGLGGLLSGETGDYITDYTNAVAKNPTVTELYNAGNEKYNVPNLANTANYYSNKLTDVIPNAFTAAKGYDIANTDIQNGISNSSAYLGPQSGRATSNYNMASDLASIFVTAGQAQNAQNLLPIQAEAPLLAQQEAAQATGWNAASANEFQGLIDKMNAGVKLSEIEMGRANALAANEEAYQQAIATSQIANQYKILTPSQTLANTFTGKSVKVA